MKKLVKTILSLAMALNLSLSSVVCTSFADFVEKDDGKTYYTDDNGKNVTGWQTIGDKKYYFDKNGTMQIGLKKIDGTYYYFSKDGKMATGTVIVEKNLYTNLEMTVNLKVKLMVGQNLKAVHITALMEKFKKEL